MMSTDEPGILDGSKSRILASAAVLERSRSSTAESRRILEDSVKRIHASDLLIRRMQMFAAPPERTSSHRN